MGKGARRKAINNKEIFGLGTLNVFILGIVSLLNDFSSEMILPILPLFISSLGGTGLAIGLVGGLISGMPELLKVFSGYYSDKLKKRKAFIFLGYLNSQIFKFLLFFSKTWVGVMIFTLCDKLGKGIREAPRDALISESMSKEKGRAFGIQRAFDTTGAILGSVAVLILVMIFAASFKSIILIAALVGFASLLPLYFLKEDSGLKGGKNKFSFKGGFFSNVLKLPKQLKLFILIAVIFSLSNFSYMFFVLKSASLFSYSGDMKSFALPIMLYVLFNIFYAGFSIFFGKLSDRIGRKKVLITGYLLFSLVCLGFIFFSSLLAMIVLFMAYGLTYAMIAGNQRALVADISSEKQRATAIGAFQTCLGIAAIFSGLIAGVLYDVNPNFTFLFGFVLSLLSAVIFIFSAKIFGAQKHI